VPQRATQVVNAHSLGLTYQDAPMPRHSEFRNIFVGCTRRRALSFEQARARQAEAQHLLAGAKYGLDSSHVLELVRDCYCSAYDCEFVAPATRLGAKLLRALPKHAVAFT
jgi:hypothetical protein